MRDGDGVSIARWHLKDAGRALTRWGAMVIAVTGAGILAACVEREGMSEHPPWLSWALAPLLPESSSGRDLQGTEEPPPQIETASGQAAPVTTAGDALPNPGFVLIGPAAPPAGEQDPAVAVEATREVQTWLLQMVSRGVMREIFVDPSKAHADPVGHYFVQIGSHQDIRLAERQLAAARGRFEAVLGGAQTRIQPVDLAARGRFYRAHIGPFTSAAGARAICDTLMQQKQDCIAVAERQAPQAGPTVQPARATTAAREGRSRVDLAEAGRGDSSLYAEKPSARDPDPEQRADALPLFTAPGLAGVPD
ncbi:MAG: SPOR domain-containing protein [Planctomycetia bacterium]|nr:SPOR domain-containing protein [Planctomycetia bacterium]